MKLYPMKPARKKMKKISLILIILTFGFCTIAFSDTTVYLKGGGKVKGEIVKKSDKEIKIRTAIGFVTVERVSIDKIEGDELTDELKPSKPEAELPVSIIQRKSPDFKDLLDLKLPEQTSELADKINSFYYNFIDKNVDIIKATISDSQTKDIIEKIENRYIAWDIDIAEKMEKIKIIVTYRPFSDSLTFKISNKPEFETEWLNRIVEETFIDSSIKIYKELLTEELACLIPLINPEYNKVQAINVINDDLVIELLNQTQTMYWTFDGEYRLKSIEKLNAKGKADIKQTYEVEPYESKYLIKSFAEKTSDSYSKREIEYQLVNGIKIPNKFFASTIKNDSDKTSLELYLDDIEVVLND